MCKLYADCILTSDSVFISSENSPSREYVATADEGILKIGHDNDYQSLVGEKTTVIDCGEQMITPGFIDVHTFFTRYAVFHIDTDASKVDTTSECMERLQNYALGRQPNNTLFGHGWNPEKLEAGPVEEKLDQNYSERAVILFATNRGACIMDQKTKEVYGLTPEECYPEVYHKIMREYLNDRAFIGPGSQDYTKLMNSRGITTIREMGFDDFYGFTDFLKEQEEKNNLTPRFLFMSQPVGEGVNIKYGRRVAEEFTGSFVHFPGYNWITDGTAANTRGDLLGPYEGTDSCCGTEIDYLLIEKGPMEVDRNGFRYSLHAQGDGAVCKVAELYDKYHKKNGRLINRHTITDMEFSNPKDLEKTGALRATREIYFQIVSLDPGDKVKAAIEKAIGNEWGCYHWNRRKILDSDVVLFGAIDLPLMITGIPEATYHGCRGYFPEGREPLNKEDVITIPGMLRIWTQGGAYNLGMEEKLGTLGEGRLADIAILGKDILEVPVEQMRDVAVAMIMTNGRIAYKK